MISNDDYRIYGALAYGKNEQITKALELIYAYRNGKDYFMSELWIDLERAIKTMGKLKGKKKDIVGLLLQGESTTYIVTKLKTNERYVFRVKKALYEAVRSYFAGTISKTAYKQCLRVQVDYRNRLREGQGESTLDIDSAASADYVIVEAELADNGFGIVDEEYLDADYAPDYSIDNALAERDFQRGNVMDFIRGGTRDKVSDAAISGISSIDVLNHFQKAYKDTYGIDFPMSMTDRSRYIEAIGHGVIGKYGGEFIYTSIDILFRNFDKQYKTLGYRRPTPYTLDTQIFRDCVSTAIQENIES